MQYVVENGFSASVAEEGALTQEQIEAILKQEEDMAAVDQRIVATENKRNEIEQLIYSMKEKLDDRSFDSCFAGQEKQNLLNKLNEEQLWIDDNHADGNLEVFSEKLDALKESLKVLAPGFHARLEQIKEEQEKV